MISRVDLHLHSTASDGQYSPSELVTMALERNLLAIAVTDHDTTAGIDEALEAARGTGLEVIPGVEISCDVPHEEVHLLGYYLDHHHPALQEKLLAMRDARLQRAKGILARLSALGLSLPWDAVAELAGNGSVGRPHVAQAMVKMGYVASNNEAFDLYIGRNGPAYVERYKISPLDAVSLLKEAHGLPVLAHPRRITHFLPSLVERGLVGMEVYYNGYSPEDIRGLAGLARKFDLIPTGGSDFHGPDVLDTVEMGGVRVPMESVKRLQALARGRD
ncbi:MAG: PHP domain-containing protein [Anaerolineales bacterium]|nr:PHP domain-containing protein [Anaerolineales bacterium]